jgi:hypothetical protein
MWRVNCAVAKSAPDADACTLHCCCRRTEVRPSNFPADCAVRLRAIDARRAGAGPAGVQAVVVAGCQTEALPTVINAAHSHLNPSQLSAH